MTATRATKAMEPRTMPAICPPLSPPPSFSVGVTFVEGSTGAGVVLIAVLLVRFVRLARLVRLVILVSFVVLAALIKEEKLLPLFVLVQFGVVRRSVRFFGVELF